MRVLVTGAAGFLGRALVPELRRRGHELVLTDRELPSSAQDAAGRLVPGDIRDSDVRRAALADADAVIHLATVAGGAAEQEPELACAVNVDAAMALSLAFGELRPGAPFVFASSIAVFGDPLPATVDDRTPLAPRMLYGAHKAMIELWLAMLSLRGDLSAISLRLPGIVARPRGPSGMKSAFISEAFHAIVDGRSCELPVSREATMWLLSVRQAANCLAQGIDATAAKIPASRAVTLPAVRASMGELVDEICRQCPESPGAVSYNSDPALERGFGRQPPLSTQLGTGLGFSSDRTVGNLVASALATL